MAQSFIAAMGASVMPSPCGLYTGIKYLYWNFTIIIESCVAFQVEPTKYYEQI